MSSLNTTAASPSPRHPTRTLGTYMSHNGRNIYVETHTLEECLVNFQSEEMRERLHEVFSTPSSPEPSQIYIPIVFDYRAMTESSSESYTLSGFWNPHTNNYEFAFWIEMHWYTLIHIDTHWYTLIQVPNTMDYFLLFIFYCLFFWV